MSDLIKRADAMGAVQDHFNADGFKGYDDGQKMMDRINALPSADITDTEECQKCQETTERVRPTGEWKGYNADNPDWLRKDGTPIFLVCDKCHDMVLNNSSTNWNYCPNCGAIMKGGAE